VFRILSDRPSQGESLLPAELLRLPEELARVDALLDTRHSSPRSRRTFIRWSARPRRSSVTCG